MQKIYDINQPETSLFWIHFQFEFAFLSGFAKLRDRRNARYEGEKPNKI